MLTIGLTGGIGSGKTMVADWLGQWGATVIDTDIISHQLTASNGLAIEPIVRAFGLAAIDEQGALDRVWMRQRVFAEPRARERLETIVHPLIRQQVLAQMKTAQGLYVVVVIPLLVESGRWLDYFDQICVVDCDEQTQIERVQKRSGLSVEQIQQIMQAQATRAERLRHADVVIVNDGQTRIETLKEEVHKIHLRWCALGSETLPQPLKPEG